MVHDLRFKPIHAKALVCALGALVFVLDMVVPADVDIAIFYCFVIVLCAWTRSLKFLWISAAIFSAATIPGLLMSPPPVTGPISWVDWANRLFGIGALLLVAVSIDARMRGFKLLENTITARKKAEHALRDSEARLRLAQSAGHVGSWEWNLHENTYAWSDECYAIFGIEPGDQAFISKWTSSINTADRPGLEAALQRCAAGQQLELDYRYEHPSRGTRWIHTRAKMYIHESGSRRVFGIFHDVTERKQVESFLQKSQSMLESVVEQRTAELRKLSAQLLQSQDEERRRIARELHDSFGQYLASLKINLDLLAGVKPSADLQHAYNTQLLSDCLDTVKRCIVETRTLSHLLHPPLLDEAGLVSAARWYVEGFAKRSKIAVNFRMPADFPRLPAASELALFRALQESLTNVHRYSGSSTVDVGLVTDAEEAVLTVRDYGHGMPEEIVRKFREQGGGVGVGLSGMRERMSELGGRLELSSDSRGTVVCAKLPLSKIEEKQAPASNVA